MRRRGGSLMAMRENGQDGCVERDGRQQPGQARTDERCDARQGQDEARADQNARGDVPLPRLRVGRFDFLVGDQPQRQNDRAEHGKENGEQRERKILQDSCANQKCQQASDDGGLPAEALRDPNVRERVGHEREAAAEHAQRRVRREGRVVAEREEKYHRPRGERQADDPSAHGWPPFSSREAGRADDDGREDQFQNEDIHKRTS